jgi:iron(III) transport system ATP-binding protein
MDIRIENLCISYSKQRVIDGLNLAIPPGCFFTLLGPSGCGKTTLLRTLAGFIPVESGRLSFGGNDVTRVPAHQRNIGMVFQDYALFPNRSVFDNAAYGLRARKVPLALIKQRVAAALDRVGLAQYASRLPAELSGGQRQRVALARALVSRPGILALDEPLGALDALTRISMQQLLARVWKELGFTALLVTHDVSEAVHLADRVVVLDQGRIALDLAIPHPHPRRHGNPALAELEGKLLAAILGEEKVGA